MLKTPLMCSTQRKSWSRPSKVLVELAPRYLFATGPLLFFPFRSPCPLAAPARLLFLRSAGHLGLVPSACDALLQKSVISFLFLLR